MDVSLISDALQVGDGQDSGQHCGLPLSPQLQQLGRQGETQAVPRRGRRQRVRGHERASQECPRQRGAVQWGQSYSGIRGKQCLQH